MNGVAMAAAGAGTLAAACVDARTGRIPNLLSRGTAVVAFACAAIGGEADASARGAAIAGAALFALYLMTRGAGIGLGDVKLAVAIGAGLGAAAGVAALGAAFVAGGAYAAGLLAAGRARRGDAIPFGPFLAAGTLATLAVRETWR